jgi:hypothetical protein
MDASLFWDGKGLIYLAKISESRYMKIAVKGMRIALPK